MRAAQLNSPIRLPYDSIWQRLPWTGPSALLTLLLSMLGVAALVTRAPRMPEHVPTVEARFVELPEPPAPTAQPEPQVVPQQRPVQRTVPVAKPIQQTSEPAVAASTDVTPPDNSATAATGAGAVVENLPNAGAQSSVASGNGQIPAVRPAVALRARAHGMNTITSSDRPEDFLDENLPLFPGEEGQGLGGYSIPQSDVCDDATEGYLHNPGTCQRFGLASAPYCSGSRQGLGLSGEECEDALRRAIRTYDRKDYAKAFAEFKYIAEVLDYAPAQYRLGIMYAEGTVVAKDPVKAAYWYKQAAEDGDEKAQFNLGQMYASGTGVEKSDQKAAYWYTKAAYHVNSDAQSNLALMYAAGTGVPKDEKKALYWFRTAAVLGNATAQYNLGVIFANGTGVAKDEHQAAFWFRKVAMRGDANAMYDLGLLYAEGKGVAKNEELAYFWWLLSASRGNQDAITNREWIEKSLTQEQISQVQAAAKTGSPTSLLPVVPCKHGCSGHLGRGMLQAAEDR